MDAEIRELAKRLLRTGVEDLTQPECEVLARIARRLHVTLNVNEVFDDQLSLGQRVADRISAFGGSWPFIILFGVVLVLWIGVNTLLGQRAFDQYPFILLNLVLSMLAAIQAPVIMMSQNRQAAKDRLAAGHDYEVNLKAELEIMRLHDKLDEMRQQHLARLLERQEEQLRLLTALSKERAS